jgi:8-oxo-dGTP diphosphatase
MKKFPVDHQGNQTMEFFPTPFNSPFPPFAALSFIWHGDQVVLANITKRGWCVPSGRIEPNETPAQTAIRESQEEAAAIIKNPITIGSFKITTESKVVWAAAFAANLDSLQEFRPTEETTDRKLFTRDELPEIYYLWNPLTEAVFQHAFDCLKR